MTENILILLKGRGPILIEGAEYKGHTRPDGKLTENWHYYLDDRGRWYHFRNEEIQAVIPNDANIRFTY